MDREICRKCPKKHCCVVVDIARNEMVFSIVNDGDIETVVQRNLTSLDCALLYYKGRDGGMHCLKNIFRKPETRRLYHCGDETPTEIEDEVFETMLPLQSQCVCETEHLVTKFNEEA